MREGENGLFVILVSKFEIRFIIAWIKVSLFKPFLSHIRDPCTSCNGISRHGKSNPSKSDLPIRNIGNEKPCQHRLILDLLHFTRNSKEPTCLKHDIVKGEAMSSFVVTGSYLMIFPPFLHDFFFGDFSSLTLLSSSSEILNLKALETLG